MTSSSYSNGRISCTFIRSVSADNLNEDRNLNESAYLLLASGSQRGKICLTSCFKGNEKQNCIRTPNIKESAQVLMNIYVSQFVSGEIAI